MDHLQRSIIQMREQYGKTSLGLAVMAVQKSIGMDVDPSFTLEDAQYVEANLPTAICNASLLVAHLKLGCEA